MMMPSSVSPSTGHRRSVEGDSDDSRSSCSLGRDSDEEGGVDFEAEGSSGKKANLDNMDALEEALPTKRGISMFYQGKSKSFTSLADATSASSVKEFAKPESPFVPKRNPPRNPLARTSGDSLRARASGISTKTAENCVSSLVPGFSVTCSRSSDDKDSYSMSMQSSSCLPPMHPLPKMPPTSISRMRSHPQNFNCRSFSLADIRCMASASSND